MKEKRLYIHEVVAKGCDDADDIASQSVFDNGKEMELVDR